MARSSRIFWIIFLFSLAWHIFWISSVKIIIPSKKYPTHASSSISFLGPILEEGTFNVELRHKTLSAGSRQQKRIIELLEEDSAGRHGLSQEEGNVSKKGYVPNSLDIDTPLSDKRMPAKEGI